MSGELTFILFAFLAIGTFVFLRTKADQKKKKAEEEVARKEAEAAQKKAEAEAEAEAEAKAEVAKKRAAARAKTAKFKRELKEMGATNTWWDDTKSGFAANVKDGQFAYFVDGEMSKIYPIADLLSVVVDKQIEEFSTSFTRDWDESDMHEDSDTSVNYEISLTITLNDPDCPSHSQPFSSMLQARKCEAMLKMAIAQAKKNPAQGE